MRRYAPIVMPERGDRHHAEQLIAIGEIRIGEGVLENFGVRSAVQAAVSNMSRVDAVLAQHGRHERRQVLIDEKLCGIHEAARVVGTRP